MKSRKLLITLIVLSILGSVVAYILFARQSSGNRLLRRAQVALNAGKLETAVQNAEEFISKNPGDWRGHSLLGKARLRLGQYAKSRESLHQAMEADADRIEPIILLAETYSKPAIDILKRPESTLPVESLEEVIGLLGREWLEKDTPAADKPVPESALGVLLSAQKHCLQLAKDNPEWAEANPDWDVELGEEIGQNYRLGAMTWRLLAKRNRVAAEAADDADMSKLAAEKHKAEATALAEATHAVKQAITELLRVIEKNPSRESAATFLVEMCIEEEDAESLAIAAKAIGSVEKPPAIAMLRLVMYENRRVDERESLAESQERLWTLIWKLEDLRANNPGKAEIELALAETLRQIRDPLSEDAVKQTAARDRTMWQSKPDRLASIDVILGDVLGADSKNFEAQILKARVLVRGRKYIEAERYLDRLKSDNPHQAAAFELHAQVCSKIGRYTAAMDSMRKVTQMLPQYSHAYGFIAAALIERGFYKQALDDAKEYYRLAPDDPAAIRVLVEAAVGDEQRVFARTVTDKAAADHSDRILMLADVADAYRLLGDEAKERATQEHAVSIKPRGVQEILAVARILEHLGREDKAESLLRDSMKQSPLDAAYPFAMGQQYYRANRVFESISMFRAAIALDPDVDGTHVALARALRDIDDLAGADKALTKAHSHNVQANILREELRLLRGGVAAPSGGTPAYGGSEVHEGIDLARLYLQQGKPDKCAEICLKGLEKTPNDLALRTMLGRAYLSQGKRVECIKQWGGVLELAPDNLVTYHYLADVMEQEYTIDKVAEKLLALPGSKSAMVDMAMGWLFGRRAGGAKKAAEAYGRVVARDQVSDHIRNRARLSRARVLAADGDVNAAQADFNVLIDVPQWKREALKARAEILVSRGEAQASDALAEWERFAIVHKDSDGIMNAVDLHLAMRKPDLALRLCQRAEELLPNNTQILMLYVRTLVRARRAAEAVSLLERIVELEPMNMAAYTMLTAVLDATNQPARALEVLDRMGVAGHEAKAGSTFVKGQLLGKWGLKRQAVECLRQVAKGPYGNIPSLQLSMGQTLLQLGQNELASELLSRVPKYANQYFPAQLQLVSTTDDLQAQLEILDALEKEAPTDGRVLLRKMRVLMKADRNDAAVKAYNDFRARAGTDVQVSSSASFMVFHYLIDKGEYQQARSLAQKVADELGSSQWRYLVGLAGLNTKPATAGEVLPEPEKADFNNTLLGIIHSVRQGDKLAADKWAARFEQIFTEAGDKTNGSIPIPPRYGILVALAVGDKSKAATYLPRASDIGVTVAGELVQAGVSATEAAQLLQATLAMDLGLYKAARGFAMDALVKRPQCQWAAKLIERGRPDQDELKKVVQTLRPSGSLLAQLTAVRVLKPDERPARLAEIYTKLAQANPGSMQHVRLQALAVDTAGRSAEALKLYRKLMAAGLIDSKILNNAACIVSAQSPDDKAQLQEALGWAQRAVQALPREQGYRDTGGWIQFLLGQKEAARANVRQALVSMKDSPEVQYHAGMIEAGFGNTELAQWHFQAAVDWGKAAESSDDGISASEARAAKLAAKALKVSPGGEK